MYRLVGGGTGLIGRNLIQSWLEQKHDVTVIGRSEKRIRDTFGTKVGALTWENLTAEKLKGAELIVNLAGANVLEKKWDAARKKELLDSRVNTTKQIAELLSKMDSPLPMLFNASAVSTYGPHATLLKNELPAAFDETCSIDLNQAPDFLTYFCREAEKAAKPAIDHGARVIFLRFGPVLTTKGGVLPNVLAPFKMFMGGPLGNGYQAFSWVAMDDAIRAINFLIPDSNAAGATNIVAPECVMQYQLAKVVGKHLHRPAVMPTPAFMLKLMLGERSQLLLEGNNVFPKRLLELGFKFEYPDIDSAMKHLLQDG